MPPSQFNPDHFSPFPHADNIASVFITSSTSIRPATKSCIRRNASATARSTLNQPCFKNVRKEGSNNRQFTGKRSNFAGACSLANSLHSMDSSQPTFPFRKAIGTWMPHQASAAYIQGVRRGTYSLGWVPLILRKRRVDCSQRPRAGTLGPLSSTQPTTAFTANRK